MTENTQPTNTKPATSKKLPLPIIIGIGCVVILVIGSLIMSIAAKAIFSKFGTSLMKKGIESKTGMKIDSEGKSLSFTDQKTGQTVNIGDQKIPDNFPKDFPLYPGAKFTGSLSGNNNKEKSQGFWLVLSTDDSTAKVKSYYEAEFKKNNWVTENTMNANETILWTVTKNNLTGTVSLSPGDKKTDTVITIMLGTSDQTSTTKNLDPKVEDAQQEEPSL
jgi:hypothetical protein